MGNDMLHDGFQRLGQAPDWRPNPTVRIIPKAASGRVVYPIFYQCGALTSSRSKPPPSTENTGNDVLICRNEWPCAARV